MSTIFPSNNRIYLYTINVPYPGSELLLLLRNACPSKMLLNVQPVAMICRPCCCCTCPRAGGKKTHRRSRNPIDKKNRPRARLVDSARVRPKACEKSTENRTKRPAAFIGFPKRTVFRALYLLISVCLLCLKRSVSRENSRNNI